MTDNPFEHPLVGDFCRLNSGERLPTLIEWADAGVLSPDDLRALLPVIWQHADAPLLTFSVETLVRLFRRAGFHRDINDMSGPPGDGLTVYRGAYPIVRRGLAWTTSPDKAAWFCTYADVHAVRAAHSGQPIDGSRVASERSRPRVYVAHAPADAILAIYSERDEQEVVADPRMLTELRVYSPRDGSAR